jgi:hypothetical protein
MKTGRGTWGVGRGALILGLLVVIAAPSQAQIGGLRRAAQRAVAAAPDPTAMLRGTPPIATNLGDAVWGVDSMDAFTPTDPMRSMLTLQRTPNGGFVLEPGYFEMHAQSYCLHAGTHGPNPGDHGDGYLYAPPRGSADNQVRTILRNSVAHPDIDQHRIQLLLWAIVARAKFEDLQPSLKDAAVRLLSPEELASLNRSALELAGPALERAMANAPPLVRQALQAEADLRNTLTSASGTFADAERVAVLAGVAPRGEGSRDIPRGRWSLHPDGYYIRYLPQGYQLHGGADLGAERQSGDREGIRSCHAYCDAREYRPATAYPVGERAHSLETRGGKGRERKEGEERDGG